jgi:hypothetical protein
LADSQFGTFLSALATSRRTPATKAKVVINILVKFCDPIFDENQTALFTLFTRLGYISDLF